jgi:branched-chain amino acid aminotransferase
VPAVSPTTFIWLDGELRPFHGAQVHILTHSLHYGLAVFEGTRVYRGRRGEPQIFRLDDHLKRLYRSAHILELDLPFTLEELRSSTLELLISNRLEECYIRHIAFIGEGVMGLHPQNNPIRVGIIAWQWGAYLGDEGIRRGIRCKISSFQRHHPNNIMIKAKASANYLTAILAKREVTRLKYDEALLLDPQGFIAEGSGENLFTVRDGTLITPPTTYALEGITRDTVMYLARRKGIPVVERPISRDELYIADEVFLTGTAAEITPVREVDDRQIGRGEPGEITRLLQKEYFSAVHGEIPELSSWLTPYSLSPVGSP